MCTRHYHCMRTMLILWGGMQAQPMRRCGCASEGRPAEGYLRNECSQNDHAHGHASTTHRHTYGTTCAFDIDADRTTCPYPYLCTLEDSSLPPSLPHSLTHSLTRSLPPSLTHSLTHSQLHPLSCSQMRREGDVSCARSLPPFLPPSRAIAHLSHTHTHIHTHSLTH